MRPAGKTACLFYLVLFILISRLYAESLPEPQPSLPALERTGEGPPLAEELPIGDSVFFIEELFAFEGVFSIDEESFYEESFADGDALPDEESFAGGEALPGAEPVIDEETLLSEESPPAGEPFSGEEILPEEETILAEEDFLDEDALFFEAPPMIFEVPVFEIRSVETIFPNFTQRQRILASTSEGIRHYFEKDESSAIIPNPALGIDLLGSVMKKNPSHLIEALVIVPYNDREFDLLDIYNALGRIEKIKDYPASYNGNEFYAFTESTRIESARNRRAVPDPSPSVMLPFSETIYLRLKEVSFGNLFIRGDISVSMYGITYSMTNFTDVRYFLVPLMRAERFSAIIYLEPVKEGILIYSMSGFYLPGFIADKVNLNPSINRRIQIFIKWITDGLRKQEEEVGGEDQ
jgi:hypothetical protein